MSATGAQIPVVTRALPDATRAEEIPPATTIATVQGGTPVVVERILPATGYFDELRGVFVAGIAAVAGAAAAGRVRDLGLERLHEVCTLDQISALKVEVAATLPGFAVPMAQAFVRVTGPSLGRRYFVDTKVADRTMVPKRLLAERLEFDWAGGGPAAWARTGSTATATSRCRTAR